MNDDPRKLAERLVAEASSRGLKISFAESCTGGLIAASVTDIPGASGVFLGSAVTYSNEAKRDILGVDGSVIAEYGAVSAMCAEKMAEGARRIFGSDMALSVTGVAGPDGGSKDKPVGTVWFGLTVRDHTRTEVKHFSGNREAVRDQSIKHAISMLLASLNNL